MDKVEFKNLDNQIRCESERRLKIELRKLREKYVEANALAKVGDTVSDRCSVIIVEHVKFDGFASVAGVTYYGPELTKKLVARKDGATGYVHQNNSFKVLNRRKGD